MAEKIIIERTIDAPIGRVWKALTDYEALKQWLPFFPDFKAQVGFRTEFDLGRDADHMYRHTVEVLEVAEGRRLAYSWDYGGMSIGSSVLFELEEEAGKTKLVLTCVLDPVPADQPDFMENASAGWNHTANGLQRFAESNK